MVRGEYEHDVVKNGQTHHSDPPKFDSYSLAREYLAGRLVLLLQVSR